MKIVDVEPKVSAISFGGLLEKIEILRSTLRWANTLDRPNIEKLLRQSNTLRDEVMQLSDRVIVLLEGQIMGELARADFDVNTIGLLMSGVRDEVST